MSQDTIVIVWILFCFVLIFAFAEEQPTTRTQYDPAPERYLRVDP